MLPWARADAGDNRACTRLLEDNDLPKLKAIVLVAALIALALTFLPPKAEATPNFARQTGRNCNFCHSAVPRLNDAGLAFKSNGFIFPESNNPPGKDHRDTQAQ